MLPDDSPGKYEWKLMGGCFMSTIGAKMVKTGKRKCWKFHTFLMGV